MTLPHTLVQEMHAAYQAGESLASVARRYGKHRSSVRELFARRCLPVRRYARPARCRTGAGGRFEALELSREEIESHFMQVPGFRVPPALLSVWRRWSLEERGQWLELLRRRFPHRPTARPLTPYSANVEPFDYCSPRAWEIVRRVNAGLSSRKAGLKLNINSEGVIYEGELWFWTTKTGYQQGRYVPGLGRPMLSRHIWVQAHGPIPPQGVIRHADGNRNNFEIENLILSYRDTLCRENQAKAMTAQSRALTALLLERTQLPTTQQQPNSASQYGHNQSKPNTTTEILRRHRRGGV